LTGLTGGPGMAVRKRDGGSVFFNQKIKKTEIEKKKRTFLEKAFQYKLKGGK
jgi:hypothetical protein